MKDIFSKRQRFSLRKLTIGVCSVLLGTTILATNAVAAEEVSATAAEATTTAAAPATTAEATTEAETTAAPAATEETTAAPEAAAETTAAPAAAEEVTETTTYEAPATPAAPAAESNTVAASTVSGSEAEAKEWIAQKESGGSYTATNGRYIGRYQLTDSYLNGDYSAENQERVADAYVAGRYGSWTAAKNFWLNNGWY